MNGLAFMFLAISAIAMLLLPRSWAALPLLMGACYMTSAQGIELGPFHFTVLRFLIVAGFVRVLFRRETLSGGLRALDYVLLAWGFWAVADSVFHKAIADTLVFRSGVVFNSLGIYLLVRIFCDRAQEFGKIIRVIAIILVPVALEMINEKLTGKNLFAFFGGVTELVQVRDGKLRAQGPFGHAILAGTVGAVCLPLMIGIWQTHKRVALVGLAACLSMVVASTSSGPLMSVIFGLFGLALWRWRHLTRQMRIGAVLAYILLDLVMKDPAYFIMARVDLTGSSTGYHRAQVIRQSIEHLSEWWLAGTDYTRHWMPYGVSYSPDHCDITNHYLYYGVWGGLPLMFLFVSALWLGFRYVGESLRLRAEAPVSERFLIWSLGAALFCQAVTCMSVAYFEQSVMFLYLNLAAIGSLHAMAVEEAGGMPEVGWVDEAIPATPSAVPPVAAG